MRSFQLLSLAILYRFAQYVSADTSLFIPGFDPQPLSVENLGVDRNGRTTWEIVPGSLTGTFEEVPFTGTATLVEGPNDAHLAYVNLQQSLTLDLQCDINGSIAACTAANDDVGLLSIIYATMPVHPLLVQGGGGPASVSSTSSSSSAMPSPSPISSAPKTSSVPSGFITSFTPMTTTPPLVLNPTASSRTSSNHASASTVIHIYWLFCTIGTVVFVLF